MEIGSPRRVESSSLRRAGRAPAGDGVGFSAETSADRPAAALTGTSPIAAVDALIALQGIGDSGEDERRGARHGEDLLRLLDEVRDGLLTGGIAPAVLTRLTAAVSRRREMFTDAKLQAILDEIDLRARVELAKFQASLPSAA